MIPVAAHPSIRPGRLERTRGPAGHSEIAHVGISLDGHKLGIKLDWVGEGDRGSGDIPVANERSTMRTSTTRALIMPGILSFTPGRAVVRSRSASFLSFPLELGQSVWAWPTVRLPTALMPVTGIQLHSLSSRRANRQTSLIQSLSG